MYLFTILLISFLFIQLSEILVERYEQEAIYLFENYEVDLQELIVRNNLSEKKQKWGYCFDTNEEIKKLAQMEVEEIVKWILEFPHDYKQLKNLSTTCQRATVTLKKGKGICNDKAILICSIFYEKNISCYVISSNELNHSISLIYYNNAWRPILTTGFINKENIEDFMSSLILVESKEKRYFRI